MNESGKKETSDRTGIGHREGTDNVNNQQKVTRVLMRDLDFDLDGLLEADSERAESSLNEDDSCR